MTLDAGSLYLLDTNICIFAMNHRPEAVLERLERTIERGHLLGISSITLHELWFGVYRSTHVAFNVARLEAFCATLDVYLFDEAAAEQAGECRATLMSAGTPIGPYDLLIAGHARALNAVLVTNNLGEFGRIEGLRVEDWTR